MVHLCRPSLHRHRLRAGRRGICTKFYRHAEINTEDILHQTRVHGAHSEQEAFPEAARPSGGSQGGVLCGARRLLRPRDPERRAHHSAESAA
uniref:Uncharacterized protein n=1 Tax=Arundo donax TaxID=35708 RepID=A0A0A9BFK4_ARUDO